MEGKLGNSSSAIRYRCSGNSDDSKGSSVEGDGDNNSNNNGCSRKDGGRVAGAGKKIGPTTRIVSGDVVRGEGNNHNNSDSDVADSDGEQKVGDHGCYVTCDGSCSNGRSGGGCCGSSGSDGVDNDVVDQDGEDSGSGGSGGRCNAGKRWRKRRSWN